MPASVTEFARRDPVALSLVDRLTAVKNDVDAYRETMSEIGRHLSGAVLSSIDGMPISNICIVCTVEDADFLANGLICGLEESGLASKIRLTCMWNERVEQFGASMAPIVKQYQEDFDHEGSVYVIVKSIISGACVVRTNLTRMLSVAKPAAVLVAAPVIFSGAEERLKSEFPPEISESFKFIYYTAHTEKNGEEVVPGIGGIVYELLGLGNASTKNLYLPNIVVQRREKYFKTQV